MQARADAGGNKAAAAARLGVSRQTVPESVRAVSPSVSRPGLHAA